MKYDKLNIDDLFLLAKQGNGTAFEEIVLRTEKQVYNLALSIVKSREDAEDITQETYLKLWRTLPDSKEITAAKRYIFNTARNTAIDLLRKKAKQNEADIFVITPEGEFEHDIADTDPASRPDETYWNNVRAQTVRECISELPLRMRELITLRDIDELSYSEIAEILGIPEGTVRSGLSRAREKLKKLIISKNIL